MRCWRASWTRSSTPSPRRTASAGWNPSKRLDVARREAARSLGGGAGAFRETWWILAHILGEPEARLLADPHRRLTVRQEAALSDAVDRRRAGEPLAYVLGRAPFLDFEVLVDPHVLIPRPETEELAVWALRWASREGRRSLRAADVGTGSGCLAIALARGCSEAVVLATDNSAAAVELATRNALRCGVADRVRVQLADLLPPPGGPGAPGAESARAPDRGPGVGLNAGCFDLVVANLPYVALEEMGEVGHEVRRYEPAEALFAPERGLLQIRRLLARLPAALADDAAVALEIGWRQGPAVLCLARRAFPRAAIRLHADAAGRPRIVTVETAVSPLGAEARGAGGKWARNGDAP